MEYLILVAQGLVSNSSLTNNVIKTKINAKLCSKTYKRGLYKELCVSASVLITLKNTTPSSDTLRIYKH